MSELPNQNDALTAVAKVTARENDSLTEPPTLSTQQMLEAIDTQIKFEADSQRNEGWSRWVIWGSIAALLWIAIDLWTKVNPNLFRGMLLALFVFVSWKIVENLIWFLLPDSRIEIGPIRFKSVTDTVHPLRQEMAVVILQYSLVLFGLIHFKMTGQWLLLGYALAAIGGSICAFISGVMIIGFPINLKIGTTLNISTCVNLICLIAINCQILIDVHSNHDSLTNTDVRLALVLNAIAFLMSRLVATASSEHLLKKLTQLRQHIAFGRISTFEANKQAEALLTGMTLKELLSPLIKEACSEAEKLSPILAEIQQLLDHANKRSTEQPAGALRMLDEMGSPPRSATPQLKRAKKAWNRFAMHAFVFSLYSRESRREIKEIADSTRKEIAGVEAQLRECLNRCQSLKAKVRRLASNVPYQNT